MLVPDYVYRSEVQPQAGHSLDGVSDDRLTRWLATLSSEDEPVVVVAYLPVGWCTLRVTYLAGDVNDLPLKYMYSPLRGFLYILSIQGCLGDVKGVIYDFDALTTISCDGVTYNYGAFPPLGLLYVRSVVDTKVADSSEGLNLVRCPGDGRRLVED